MKKLLYFIPVAIFFMACGNGSTGGGTNLPMANSNDSTSYAFGTFVSENLVKIKNDVGEENAINLDQFHNGVVDGVAGNSKLTPEEAEKVMAAFSQMAQAASMKKSMEENQTYLAEKAAAEGVQSTPSGLLYKVIQEGTGATPTITDDVTVHYTGKLANGQVFDSSVQRGKPISFAVTGVIPGWTEGLQLMKEGAKYEFYIPSELGYGSRGTQGIPPNSALFFEVELIKLGKLEE